jgi:hypothetical protein
MHDLRIPIPGFTANIDHVVVRGREVFIIDAKVWRPAAYWTFRGRTRRGWSRFEPAEKQTMRMAHERVSGYLTQRGIKADVRRPLVVVVPSSRQSNMSLRWPRAPGATAMHVDKFESWVTRQLRPRRRTPADPRIVQALADLLNGGH